MATVLASHPLFTLESVLPLWGFRDPHPQIAQATEVEQTIARDLHEAYSDYLASPDDYSIGQLDGALTTAIERLEIERLAALKHLNAQTRSSENDRTSSRFVSFFRGLFGETEETHYRDMVKKIASRLDSLRRFRDSLPLPSVVTPHQVPLLSTHRRLREVASFAPVAQQQYYCAPSSICDLSQLNGVMGFVLHGEASSNTGLSVSSAGDINGDGIADFLLGSTVGKAFVLFGSKNGTTWAAGSMSLGSLMDGQRGFVLRANNESTLVVGAAGDINGDGLDDIMVGRAVDYADMGTTYIVFGSNSSNAWGNGNLTLTSFVNGQRGFALVGALGDSAGSAVATAGDINGDGFADVMVGAAAASVYGQSLAGKTYVVFGSNRTNAWGNGTVKLSNFTDGVRGFVLLGEKSSDQLGNSVGTAGDVNGDGLADFAVGARSAGHSNMQGRTYVIFGTDRSMPWGNGILNISSLLDGQRGFALQGVPSDESGSSVSAAGDVNGDGLADLIIASNFKSYVVFGSDFPDAWGTGIVNLKDLMNGRQGFALVGFDFASSVVSAAGDINHDGLADIMVGFPSSSPPGMSTAGQTYVVYGSNLPNAWGFGVLDVRSLSIQHGFTLQGEFSNDASGTAVSSAGDIDGDEVTDLIVVAQGTNAACKIYVLLGKDLGGYFQANNLRVTANQPAQLSLQNLNVSHTIIQQWFNVSRNQTQFLIDKAEQGYFSLMSSPSLIINSFSMRDLMEGQVQFVHTGNAVAPKYRLCAEWSLLKVCSDGQVDFLGYPPILVSSDLTVHQNSSSVLEVSDLGASDQDNLPNQLWFVISNPSHGHFTLYDTATNTTNQTTTFTQQAVLDGKVRFVHDGTRFKPAFNVSVNDTKSITAVKAATIKFIYAPELNLTASITLDQGQPTTLTTDDISASDVETFQGSIIIEAANIAAGYFAYSSNLQFPITGFQQLSLITGGVRFVQDGSDNVPSFELCAFDGVLRSPWQKPQIHLNHRPIRQGSESTQKQVVQGEDFSFALDSVRFIDPDGLNDTLTYRAQLKGVGTGGGSPLPPEIQFTPPDQFSGNIPSVGSFNIEVIVTDPRGVAASASLLVSSAEPGFIIQQFYTGLSSILGVGVTVFAYLWLRRRIAKHRRKFPFVNHLRKVLNLSYYDFTRFDGDAYKTKVNDFFQKLPLEFYNELTPQEQRSFAVCVAEILVKRGLVYRSDTFGGFFGICCWLNVGWPNDLDLKKFDVQSHAIAVEALNSWKGDQQPLNRWAYHSPSTHEKFHVFCCCTKPASAKRWPAVALTELKTHEGTTP